VKRRVSGATESPNDSAPGPGLTHESLPHLHPLWPRSLAFHKVAGRNNHLVTVSLISPMFKATLSTICISQVL
jgi:hypothetical protein